MHFRCSDYGKLLRYSKRISLFHCNFSFSCACHKERFDNPSIFHCNISFSCVCHEARDLMLHCSILCSIRLACGHCGNPEKMCLVTNSNITSASSFTPAQRRDAQDLLANLWPAITNPSYWIPGNGLGRGVFLDAFRYAACESWLRCHAPRDDMEKTKAIEKQ